MNKWEKDLSNIVFDYLKKGRPNWDVPHTKAVIHWAKYICKGESTNNKDSKIIISAAYLHDIGYSFTEVKANYESVEAAKPDHMIIGAEESKIILGELGYTEKEIEEVSTIVKKHDRINRKLSPKEQVLIEADSLAQIDRERVPPSFNQEDYDKFIVQFKKDRVPVIRTRTGLEALDYLWAKAVNYKVKS